MSEASAPKRVTRRTVAKGAAWTVPAIAVATPAHATATSGLIFFNLAESCKHSSGPGAVRYYFVFNTTLPVGTEVTLSAWTWDPNDGKQLFTEFNPEVTTVTADGRLVYRFLENGTSATNGELCVTFNYSGTESGAGQIPLCTGNNNYSSCGNNVPTPSAGDTVVVDPPAVEWP